MSCVGFWKLSGTVNHRAEPCSAIPVDVDHRESPGQITVVRLVQLPWSERDSKPSACPNQPGPRGAGRRVRLDQCRTTGLPPFFAASHGLGRAEGCQSVDFRTVSSQVTVPFNISAAVSGTTDCRRTKLSMIPWTSWLGKGEGGCLWRTFPAKQSNTSLSAISPDIQMRIYMHTCIHSYAHIDIHTQVLPRSFHVM